MTDWNAVAAHLKAAGQSLVNAGNEISEGGPPPKGNLISEAEQRAFSSVYMQPRTANQWAKHNPDTPGIDGNPIAINPTRGENYPGETAVECWEKWSAAKPGVPTGSLVDVETQRAWLEFKELKFPVAVRINAQGQMFADAGKRVTGDRDRKQRVAHFVEGVAVLKSWGA